MLKQQKTYIGYIFVGGQCKRVDELEGSEGLVQFLKRFLVPEWTKDNTEIRILDPQEGRSLFQAIGGVDLYSELQHHGVSLPDVYKELKTELHKGLSALNTGDDGTEGDDSDPIGLSGQEIVMRVETCRSARAAKSVKDVAEFIEGTYFDAFFDTEDGARSWGYFDSEDLTVQPMKNTGGGWQEDLELTRIHLKPEARVKYVGAGEDSLSFVILDPP